jgi:hypothetical protein
MPKAFMTSLLDSGIIRKKERAEYKMHYVAINEGKESEWVIVKKRGQGSKSEFIASIPDDGSGVMFVSKNIKVIIKE